MKLNFNLRDPNSKKETPLKLIIRWNNQRLVYPTRLSIKPSLWNFNMQRVRELEAFHHSVFKSAKSINSHITSLETSAKIVWEQLQNNNNSGFINPQQFKDLLDIKLKRRNDTVITFIQFFKGFSNLGEDRISRKFHKYISYNTSKQIKSTFMVFEEIAQRKEFDFAHFEENEYNGTFDEIIKYLIEVKRYASNTIASHIKNIKVVLDSAFEKKLLKSNHFKHYTYSFEEVDTIALNPQELDAIYELNLRHKPLLEKQRDIFIIASWTALRYSDLVRVKSSHVHKDFIKIRTIKTDEIVIIPMARQVKNILIKYDNEFPKAFSVQKYNESIKEFCSIVPDLQKMIEINKTVAGQKQVIKKPKWQFCSSHTSRRSACTNFYKMGIPVSMIMKLSGHVSEKNFFKYIKIEKEEAAEIMLKQINMMNITTTQSP